MLFAQVIMCFLIGLSATLLVWLGCWCLSYPLPLPFWRLLLLIAAGYWMLTLLVRIVRKGF